MKKCEMLMTTSEGQEVGCTLFLDGDRVTFQATPGHEVLMRNMMNDVPVTGVEKWFDSLPRQYTGSYLRAKIVQEES